MIARIETGLDRAGRNTQNLNLLVRNLRAEIDSQVKPKNSWSEEYRSYLLDSYAKALETCIERAVELEEFEQAAVMFKELQLIRIPEKEVEKSFTKVF